MATGKQWNKPPAMALTPGATYRATLTTNQGDIVIDLLTDDAPKTVNNFVFLAREGFYDGVPFHRVIKDFMIQTGDPTGTGTAAPVTASRTSRSIALQVRIVAMANAGKNTNGSQFFIMHRSQRLPTNYMIFGQVARAWTWSTRSPGRACRPAAAASSRRR